MKNLITCCTAAGIAEWVCCPGRRNATLNEFPDYTFTSACASYYKWIKLNEPEMFEEIKQRVKEGRWAIV
ncbi:MAG: hypothetical protein IJ993_03090, partial [Akkermansia sp.]|nr:hypothetical protein [Akkermansia sp.]